MPSAADRILSDVRDLAPSLAARAAEIEAARRLPPALVEELKRLGLFRMVVPKSHGGLEIEFPTSVDILAALAAGDGATGRARRSAALPVPARACRGRCSGGAGVPSLLRRELLAHANAGTIDPTFFTRVLSTVAWVAECSTRVVDACYQAGGGSALYDTSPLQRRLRDIHTLTQHASVQENVFVNAGAEKLGKPGSFGP
ncbi:MAG TPA: acyl-CoA dehydrogenase family protein [Candidatus Binatia bacterium]|nr:acyl-CoA dehydrogenase family protein [Candidatus Binatia bacterium]